MSGEILGISIETWIIILAFVGALLSVAAVALPMVMKQHKGKRMKAVSQSREELSRQQLDHLNKGSNLRQKRQTSSNVELMKKILEFLKLDEKLSSRNLKMSLFQAGYRGQSALVMFLFAQAAGIIVGPVVTFLVIASFEDFPYPFSVELGLMAVGSVVGFYLPKMIVTNAAQKRQIEINSGFADALDLMVICVEGGLSIENAFEKVTEEIAADSPMLAQEFGLTSAELAYLGDRHKAYLNFADRTGLPAIKSLSTTLIQSEKYGTPVGQALKVLSGERRQDRMNLAEQKGAALPAKLTVPMIVFFLPPLFLVVIGPAIIQVLDM